MLLTLSKTKHRARITNYIVSIFQIFKRDFHVDDRDGLTDMTLLHYASKSGSEGIGDREGSLQLIQVLLDNGATPELQCRWTHMTALHYAAFFDVVPAIRLLLKELQIKGES